MERFRWQGTGQRLKAERVNVLAALVGPSGARSRTLSRSTAGGSVRACGRLDSMRPANQSLFPASVSLPVASLTSPCIRGAGRSWAGRSGRGGAGRAPLQCGCNDHHVALRNDESLSQHLFDTGALGWNGPREPEQCKRCHLLMACIALRGQASPVPVRPRLAYLGRANGTPRGTPHGTPMAAPGMPCGAPRGAYVRDGRIPQEPVGPSVSDATTVLPTPTHWPRVVYECPLGHQPPSTYVTQSTVHVFVTPP